MQLLLDTQIFIWFFTGNPRLSSHLRQHIANPANTLILSVASIWEMQIKTQTGKLELQPSVELFVKAHIETSNLLILPVQAAHVWGLKQLPMHHRDPFDRIMIAQAIVENIVLVSVDKKISQYSVSLLQ